MHPMLRVAFVCVRVSAKHIMSAYQRSQRHPQTITLQQQAQTILIEELSSRYPYLHYITDNNSQASTHDAEWLCYMQALDGFENYQHNIPLFSISIAFARMSARTGQHELELALIYDPLHDHFFHAQKGHGAFLNQRRLRIHTPSWGNKPQHPLVLTALEASFHAELITATHHIMSMRSFSAPALSGAMVAYAQADGMIYSNTHPHDIAAAHLIIHEAGGMTLALDRKDYTWAEPGLFVMGHAAFCGWLQQHWII